MVRAAKSKSTAPARLPNWQKRAAKEQAGEVSASNDGATGEPDAPNDDAPVGEASERAGPSGQKKKGKTGAGSSSTKVIDQIKKPAADAIGLLLDDLTERTIKVSYAKTKKLVAEKEVKEKELEERCQEVAITVAKTKAKLQDMQNGLEKTYNEVRKVASSAEAKENWAWFLENLGKPPGA